MPAFTFNEKLAAHDDKVTRQCEQENKWFVIDNRTVKKVTGKVDLYVHGTKVEVKAITAEQATPELLKERGMVWVLTDEKPYVLFEGSMLSNFEPCDIAVKHEDKKLVLKNVEHYFQLMKCAFVHIESGNELAKTMGEYLLKTNAPTYMIAIARNLPMDDKITTTWREFNIDLLETAVEYKVLEMPQMVSLIKVAKTKFGIPTSISDIEFWECNKHDDVYGIKKDLHTAVHELLAGKRFDASARNEMGRILRIHLVCEQSKMTPENRALIDKIEKHMIAQFGERVVVEKNFDDEDDDDDMESEPAAKKQCGRCLSCV